MSKDKPREWWIDKNTAAIRPIPGTPYDRNSIHVIEKSAYDACVKERDEFRQMFMEVTCNPAYSPAIHKRLKEERDQLRAELERVTKLANRELSDRLCHIEKLTAENARLRAALEFYAKGYHIEYVTTKDGIKAKANTDNGEIARAALKGEGE